MSEAPFVYPIGDSVRPGDPAQFRENVPGSQKHPLSFTLTTVIITMKTPSPDLVTKAVGGLVLFDLAD